MPTEKQREIFEMLLGASKNEALEWEVMSFCLDSLFIHSPELVIEKLHEALHEWDI